jgi:hypothetical protein
MRGSWLFPLLLNVNCNLKNFLMLNMFQLIDLFVSVLEEIWSYFQEG